MSWPERRWAAHWCEDRLRSAEPRAMPLFRGLYPAQHRTLRKAPKTAWRHGVRGWLRAGPPAVCAGRWRHNAHRGHKRVAGRARCPLARAALLAPAAAAAAVTAAAAAAITSGAPLVTVALAAALAAPPPARVPGPPIIVRVAAPVGLGGAPLALPIAVPVAPVARVRDAPIIPAHVRGRLATGRAAVGTGHAAVESGRAAPAAAAAAAAAAPAGPVARAALEDRVLLRADHADEALHTVQQHLRARPPA